MPNGELSPPPELPTGPNAAYLQWLGDGLMTVYHGLGEVKAEVSGALNWQRDRDQERLIKQGRDQERQEQKDRGEKRLGRWKLRFETVAVLIGVATGGAGLGGLIAALVFG
jgi:hypothetical protein